MSLANATATIPLTDTPIEPDQLSSRDATQGDPEKEPLPIEAQVSRAMIRR